MSTAKIKFVGKAQKDPGKCEKCGKELFKGDPYRWFKVGFRSRHKHVRCTDTQCMPKPSELESTSLSNIMAAFEAYEAKPVSGSDENWAEDLKGAVEEIQAAFEDYCSEKSEALDGWPNGNSQFEEAFERASAMRDAAEQVEVDEEAEDPDAEIERVMEELDEAMNQ
jgi:hypothetical protein